MGRPGMSMVQLLLSQVFTGGENTVWKGGRERSRKRGYQDTTRRERERNDRGEDVKLHCDKVKKEDEEQLEQAETKSIDFKHPLTPLEHVKQADWGSPGRQTHGKPLASPSLLHFTNQSTHLFPPSAPPSPRNVCVIPIPLPLPIPPSLPRSPLPSRRSIRLGLNSRSSLSTVLGRPVAPCGQREDRAAQRRVDGRRSSSYLGEMRVVFVPLGLGDRREAGGYTWSRSHSILSNRRYWGYEIFTDTVQMNVKRVARGMSVW